MDEKISLCRKKIAELEVLAKLIYDRWFVEFEFPDAGGRPYKSNGGKMVWNKTLKRDIPNEWTSARLDSIVSDGGESIDPAEVGDLPYTPIDSLPIRRVSFFNPKPSSEAQSSLIRYRKGDILLGAMRVYFHRVCIAPYGGVARTTTIAMRACRKELSAFAFETINTDQFIEYAVVQSNGSQQPFVTWNSVRDFSFAAPSFSLWQEFEKRVGPILDEIVHLEKSAFEASHLRDWLLPMLMNGQVEVRA